MPKRTKKKLEVYLGPLVAGAGLWSPDMEPPKARSVSLFTDGLTGLLKQGESLPVQEMRRTQPWLVQIEPENHIESLVGLLDGSPIGRDAIFCGLSFKDRTALKALASKGCIVNRKPLIPGTDVPLIPDLFIRAFSKGYLGEGTPVLVSRHIMEHASDPGAFLATCRKYVGESGYLILEVPDAEPAIDNFDFSEVWDEHMSYFTSQSLRRTLEASGLKVLRLEKMQSDGESVLCVLAQPCESVSILTSESVKNLVAKTNAFLLSISNAPELLAEKFSKLDIASVAILGANHRASNLIDIFLSKRVTVHVFDDDPRKQGLTISSDRIPVMSRHLFKSIKPQPDLLIVALNKSRGVGLLTPLSNSFNGNPLALTIDDFYKDFCVATGPKNSNFLN